MSHNQPNVRKIFLPLTKLIPGNILVTMDVCSIHNNIPSSKCLKGIEIRLKRSRYSSKTNNQVSNINTKHTAILNLNA